MIIYRCRALVEEIAITSANINDGRPSQGALPDDPGEVFVDSAYRDSHFHDAVRAKGRVPHIVATGTWGRDEAETLQKLTEYHPAGRMSVAPRPGERR